MRPFDGNFHIPPARFRQFEDGRVEESIGRRFRGGRAFHGASGPGRLQAHGHLRLRHAFAGRGVLYEHADVHRPGPERRGRSEDRDLVAAGPLAQPHRTPVRPGEGRGMKDEG